MTALFLCSTADLFTPTASIVADITIVSFPSSVSVLQLHQNAIGTSLQLRSKLRSRNKRIEQLQASQNEMVSIAGGFRGILTKLEPAAKQGRMMAALLEMLLTRTKLPAEQMGDPTPIQLLESVIEELEALR